MMTRTRNGSWRMTRTKSNRWRKAKESNQVDPDEELGDQEKEDMAEGVGRG